MIVRRSAAILVFSGMAFLALPAAAQQVVETSTGKTFSGDTCAVSEAMLTEIRNGDAADKAETRARLNALLDAALASPKTRNGASSPVTVVPGPSPQS
jgi:deoxyribose-phosphate aldolase